MVTYLVPYKIFSVDNNPVKLQYIEGIQWGLLETTKQQSYSEKQHLNIQTPVYLQERYSDQTEERCLQQECFVHFHSAKTKASARKTDTASLDGTIEAWYKSESETRIFTGENNKSPVEVARIYCKIDRRKVDKNSRMVTQKSKKINKSQSRTLTRWINELRRIHNNCNWPLGGLYSAMNHPEVIDDGVER